MLTGIPVIGFAPGPRSRPLEIDGPRVLHVHAEDTDDHWYVTIESTRTKTSSEGDSADLTLTGTAESLYVLLWNRPPDGPVTMTGDTDLIDLWHGNFRVNWK